MSPWKQAESHIVKRQVFGYNVQVGWKASSVMSSLLSIAGGIGNTCRYLAACSLVRMFAQSMGGLLHKNYRVRSKTSPLRQAYRRSPPTLSLHAEAPVGNARKNFITFKIFELQKWSGSLGNTSCWNADVKLHWIFVNFVLLLYLNGLYLWYSVFYEPADSGALLGLQIVRGFSVRECMGILQR